MELFLLYVFTRLDVWSNVALVISTCSLFGMVICLGPMQANADDQMSITAGRRWSKRLAVIFLVCGPVFLFLPNKKDAAIILAGWGILEVAKSETSKRLASKSVELIEQTLDSYLKKNSAAR